MTRLFGTNGIRGIVNQNMTGELALHIGRAWGTYFRKTIQRPKIAIGTDARLSNEMLKNAISAGLLSTGCDVIDIGLVPTPTVQYTVKTMDFDSGVMITASHNPPQFNGIKGFSADGIEFSKKIEEEIENIYFEKNDQLVAWNQVGMRSSWSGAITQYIKKILSLISIDSIQKKKFHIILDCGNGVGGYVVPTLLKQLNCTVTSLNCTPDGTFPGRNSEPIKENLGTLLSLISESPADFGVALDGDADRAIFVDEQGSYILGDKTLSLVAKYMIGLRKGSTVVTPVTTSSCLDEVVDVCEGQVIRTRVGSPVVAQVMKESKALFGGEENGGLIFPDFHLGRDAAMSITKILEILAMEEKPLSELLRSIPNYEMYKTKIQCPDSIKDVVLQTLQEKEQIDSDIEKIDTTDGIKLYLQDGWVLVRPSGTEPLFRIFSESTTKEQAEFLAQYFTNITEEIISDAAKSYHK